MYLLKKKNVYNIYKCKNLKLLLIKKQQHSEYNRSLYKKIKMMSHRCLCCTWENKFTNMNDLKVMSECWLALLQKVIFSRSSFYYTIIRLYKFNVNYFLNRYNCFRLHLIWKIIS